MAPAFTVQRVEGGFPHSEILGSKLVRSSPRHIAAYHVLHRLSAPRHPPDALTTLDYSHDRCSLGLTEHPSKKKDLSLDFSKDDFACQAHPALLAAGQGWFARTRCRACRICCLFTISNIRAAHPVKVRARTSTRSRAQSRSMDTGYGPKDQKDRGGACRDRTDDLKLAKLPLSQLS